MIDIETFVTKAKEKGYSDEKIYSYLVKKGLVKEDPMVNVKEMEARIKNELKEEYDQKFKDETEKIREELKQESKHGIKNILKRLIFQDDTH